MRSLKAYIGPNGAGKTYQLTKFHNDNSENSLLISEEGHLIYSSKKRVSYDKEYTCYSYLKDETKRGQLESQKQSVKLKPHVKEILKFIDSRGIFFNSIQSPSLGQKKISNILSLLTTVNLNEVQYILLDEPESSLDEKFLLLMADLINLLCDRGYEVKIGTHSSRLLYLLNANVEELVFLRRNHSNIQISTNDIKNAFKKTDKEIGKYKYDEDRGIRTKQTYHCNAKLFEAFLSIDFYTSEFYDCLFYDNIFLVEGITDLISLKALQHSSNSFPYVFQVGGKPLLLTFAYIFKQLKKTVTIMYDGDSTPKRYDNMRPESYKHTQALTFALRACKDDFYHVIENENDLESQFSIDPKDTSKYYNVGKRVSQEPQFKPYAAFCHFSKSDNIEKLKEWITPSSTNKPILQYKNDF